MFIMYNKASMKVLILFCVILAVNAGTFYISPDGDDNNPGTEAQPWKSVNKCTSLSAGDTAMLRGGTYEGPYIHSSASQNVFDPPVTIMAYPGETPLITGAGTYGTYFNLFAGSWILDGIHFNESSTDSVWIVLAGAKNTIIRNCSFGRTVNTQVRMTDCVNVTIENCNFVGAGDPENQGESDNIYVLGSDYILIQDSYFAYGAHAAVDVIDYASELPYPVSSYVILRRNVIDSHWGGGLYASRYSSWVLFEDNILRLAGGGTYYPKSSIHIAANYTISRRNILTLTDPILTPDNCLAFSSYSFAGRTQDNHHNRFYNNLLYKCGRAAMLISQRDICTMGDNKFLNNILYYNRIGGDINPDWPNGNFSISIETYHADAALKWGEDKFAEGVLYFKNNLILNADEMGDKPDETSVYWLEYTNHVWTLADVQEQYPAVFEQNVNFNPGMTDPDNGDYSLRSDSLSIDAGSHLTITIGSGSNTDQVTVEDPYFFIDGWTLVEGDTIIVGSNSPVMITNVDYETGLLTLASPITFSDADPVSLSYFGSAPDLGPLEFEPANSPSGSGPSGNNPSSPGNSPNSPSGSNSPSISVATKYSANMVLGFVGSVITLLNF